MISSKGAHFPQDIILMGVRWCLAGYGLILRWEPYDIPRYDTDNWGAYRRYLPPVQHVVEKLSMPRIERKHLTLRTRLKRLNRQTRCFSRSTTMPEVLIGLFINRYEFGSVGQ
jgi:IS1 family transposase